MEKSSGFLNKSGEKKKVKRSSLKVEIFLVVVVVVVGVDVVHDWSFSSIMKVFFVFVVFLAEVNNLSIGRSSIVIVAVVVDVVIAVVVVVASVVVVVVVVAAVVVVIDFVLIFMPYLCFVFHRMYPKDAV